MKRTTAWADVHPTNSHVRRIRWVGLGPHVASQGVQA